MVHHYIGAEIYSSMLLERKTGESATDEDAKDVIRLVLIDKRFKEMISCQLDQIASEGSIPLVLLDRLGMPGLSPLSVQQDLVSGNNQKEREG